MELATNTILIAGDRRKVGSAIGFRLRKVGQEQFLTVDHQTLDLLDQTLVRRFFAAHQSGQDYRVAEAGGNGQDLRHQYV